MIGGATRRAVLGGIAAAIVGVPLLVDSAAAAGPTSVTISGQDLDDPLTVRAEKDPDQFSAVLGQVAWLATAKGNATAALPADKLGPKYTAVVSVADVPTQTYDLYPLAAGGPRAYRPAKQPGARKTTATWVYAKLTMPQTLISVGVPLPHTPDKITGGLGGGAGIDTVPVPGPDTSLGGILAKWRLVTLLNGAVILVITAGLAGISFLIRRKV
jgi:hypothetical protein